MTWALLAMAAQSWHQPEAFCTITDERVFESSGLAASTAKPGVFYTHNDSGDSARFFRFNRNGELTAIFKLRGAKAVDWEDMAAAKIDGVSYLYLGDVGDNARKRESVTVYRVRDPYDRRSGTIDVDQTYTLRYPDQARDCEAIFVDAKSGDVYFVTKAREKATFVYRLPAPRASGASTLESLGSIPVDTGSFGGKLVTGGDASPDGKYVALRTYSAALVYEVDGPFADWTKAQPVKVRMPQSIQAEAIAFTMDGTGLLVSSEGSPCPIHLVRRKFSR